MDKIEETARRTREKYGDIIDSERPKSLRAKMSLEMRAAQFAPFAALTGYHESVEETEGRVSAENETGGIQSEVFYE